MTRDYINVISEQAPKRYQSTRKKYTDTQYLGNMETSGESASRKQQTVMI